MSNMLYDSSPTTDIPKGWTEELWKICWDESNQRWNITGEEWKSLSSPQQFVLATSYQLWYSSHFSLPLEKIIFLPGLYESYQTLVLRLIPPGEFWMGSPDDEPGHNYTELRHPVAITRPYYFSKYLTTQAQWTSVMGQNPSKFQSIGGNAPVEQINWMECQDFCRQINEKISQQDTKNFEFQIPTEAQWEYACRAGVTSCYFWAGKLEDFEQYGWDKENSGQTTHPVGQKLPNAWGLHDMVGLAWQWCKDVKAYYYLEALVEDPCNEDGYGRLIRGGSWRLPAKYFRSSIQIVREPDFCDAYLGLRVVACLKDKDI